jgi:ATP-dependent helicase/nuclease subunit A
MTEGRLPDVAAREAIEHDLDTTFLAEAGAGSGKTTSLVKRMVALLTAGRATASSLAAVTFTRKAAAQLRQRFQIALEEAASTAGPVAAARIADALSNLDRCRIGTIHAFCASLLLERPVEAGLDPARLEVEQQEAEHLSERVFTEWIEARLAAEDETLTRLLSLGVRVDDLAHSFRTLLVFPDVVPLTGPPRPRPDLTKAREALRTFLDFAAAALPGEKPDAEDEFQEKVRHALRSRELPEFETDAGVSRVLPLFEAKARTVQYKWKTTKLAKDVLERAERLRADIVVPALAQWRLFLHPLAISLLRPAVDAAVQARRDRGLLAYEDLLLLARDLLRDRPPVRRYFRERLSHLLVDEFQDTDPLQAELLLFLTAPDSDARDPWTLTPEPGSLFVVGDPKQSIYRFRRADIALYERFKSRILAGGGRVLLLTASFRSAPLLAKALNRVLADVLPPAPSETQAAFAPLESVEAEPAHSHGAFRLVTSSDAGKYEAIVAASAEQVARWISWAVTGGFQVTDRARGTSRDATASDFLVLTRRKRYVSIYARALEARGLPVDVSGSEGFSVSQGLRALRPLLQAALDPGDEVSAVAFLTGPLSGIDDSALYAFRRAGGRFSAAVPPPEGTDERLVRGLSILNAAWEDARRLPPGAALARIVRRLGILSRLASTEAGDLAAGNVLKVLTLARRLSALGGSFRSVAERLDAEVESRELEEMSLAPARLDAVQVMNVHRAKGLEAPVVILAEPVVGGHDRKPLLHVSRDEGVARGWFCLTRKGLRQPVVWAVPPDWPEKEALEERFEEGEEDRLLYVAATRARETLLVNVTLKKDGSPSGAWAALAQGLPDAPRPEERAVLEAVETPCDLGTAFAESQSVRAARWAAATIPSFAVTPVTKLAKKEGPRAPSAAEEARGVAWGRVMHQLLEAAMRTPGLELLPLAENLLREEELPPELLDAVLRTAASVTSSPLWTRAERAQRRFVEAPFAMLVPSRSLGIADAPAETLLKGTIDLVFEEDGVWHIVDWKSDVVGDNLAALVQHYAPQVAHYRKAWEALTKQPAKAGLYFMDTGHLEWLGEKEQRREDKSSPRQRSLFEE